MRDFTLKIYNKYLDAIKGSYSHILRFDEYMSLENPPNSFCLIRHDVDRKASNALKMARLEAESGIKSTYYFRSRKSVFKENIIRTINDLGHEIGYHYENLSDFKGNFNEALQDFEIQLKRMRDLVPVNTISMHGRPLSKFDNRDMWKRSDGKKILKEKYDLLGEIYLHIDYSDVAYIGDTGRNWTTSVHNKRDSVNSAVTPDFKNGDDLLTYLSVKPASKLVFQIHPERWSGNPAEYWIQFSRDLAANTIKRII